MELVDMTDSKSVAFKSVSVRVRPLVPYTKPLQSIDCEGFLLRELFINYSSNNSIK